jgi:hypothetical protein
VNDGAAVLACVGSIGQEAVEIADLLAWGHSSWISANWG